MSGPLSARQALIILRTLSGDMLQQNGFEVRESEYFKTNNRGAKPDFPDGWFSCDVQPPFDWREDDVPTPEEPPWVEDRSFLLAREPTRAEDASVREDSADAEAGQADDEVSEGSMAQQMESDMKTAIDPEQESGGNVDSQQLMEQGE